MRRNHVIAAQRITFLGFVLDSMAMTITLTDGKKVRWKPVECQAIRKHKGNYEAFISLSPSAKEKRAWWIENVDMAFNPISHGNPDIEIRTDASLQHYSIKATHSVGVHFGANSSPWRAHVFSTRVSAWRLPFKADSRGNFTSHRFPLELNFIIAGFEEFTSTIIIDCVRNGTLGQGLRGSTPLSCHAHSCRAFRIAIAPRQTLYKFVYQGLQIFLVRLSDHPRYLIRGHYKSVCDVMSGYVHIRLSTSSRTLFRLTWKSYRV